ncbi:hypothetical protein GCM10020295_06350 [Streptomyces cinereospinus]
MRDAVDAGVRTVSGRYGGLEVTTDIVEGDVVDALAAAAAQSEMLVLGSAATAGSWASCSARWGSR